MSPLLAAAISVAFLTQDPSRLIAASNVRLRTAPAETAEVVASVPLGAALVPLETGGDGGSWVRLRMADGRDGWTPSRLARKFTPETKASVFEALIKERLARTGDSFQARVELIDFVDRARVEIQEPEASGRLALHWLTAMSQTLRAMPVAQSKAQPYAAWLAARQASVQIDASAGAWKLRREAIVALHDREKDTSSADDIAWFAVSYGLPGECARFLPCAIRVLDQLNGDYLRRHSAGRYIDAAIAPLLPLSTTASTMTFDRARDCRELLANLTPLRAAVAATRATERQRALDALDKISSPCGR